MKLASIRGPDGSARVAVVADGHVFDVENAVRRLPVPAAVVEQLARHGLTPSTGGMLRLLQAGRGAWASLAEGPLLAGRPLAEVELLAPVPRPGKIVAVGRNYADHAKETGVAPFERPRIIAKLPSSVCAPGARIAVPPGIVKLDFEIELAVVIGAFAHRVPRERALDVVAGYTMVDDLSAREFQFDVSPAQTTFAKSLDGFCPMGPWLVTADEIPDPQALALECRLNGRVMQRGRTADMLFPVAMLIEYLSGLMTLEPGDVLATGTPAGSGAFRTPPVWLQPGDQLTMQINGIGTLEHRITGPTLPCNDP
jgi:2-keto-4-pentenoate hydratase/2-oxohepta-3-ene-1,7-dioic acid hydratase in catechol pathway